jgi:hypothetical protein
MSAVNRAADSIPTQSRPWTPWRWRCASDGKGDANQGEIVA